MKELKEFTINLEDDRNSFCIGEPMRGHIILNFDEPAEMRNIKVRFYGEAFSQLNGIHGGKNGSKNKKKENVVDLTKLLFGLQEGTVAESVPLHPNGTYRYDFNFQLPRYLPCSFESPKEREWGLAFIRYYIEATITRPWRTNVSKQVPVNVNEIIDTSLPEYSYRPGCQTQKELGSCLSDGMLSIEAYLDDICYNQGGDILISCSAENDSNRIMTSVYAKLCRRTRYRRKNETKTYVDVVSEYFGDRVLPKRSVSWTNLKFKVPDVGPTITKSKRVNVDYYLRVGMYQLFRDEIHVDLPIVIGMTKAFLEQRRMDEEQLGNDVSINVDPVPSQGIDMQAVNRQQLEDIADIFMQMPYEGSRPSVQYISALARKNRRKNSIASTPRQSIHDDSDGSLIGNDRRGISKSADFLEDGYYDDPGYLSPGGLGSRRASETSLYASARPKVQAGSQRKISSNYPSRQNSTTPRQQISGSSAWERINKPRQNEASMRKAASQSAIETSRRPDSSASSQERSPRKSPAKRPTVRKTASQGMIDMKTAAQITAGLSNVRRKGGLKIKGQEKQGLVEEKRRLGQEKHGLGEEKRRLGQEKQDLGEEKRRLGQEKQGLGEEKRRLGQEKQGLGEEKQRLGQEKRGLREEKQRLGQEKQGLREEEKRLGQEKQGSGEEKQRLGQEKQGSGEEKQRLGQEKQGLREEKQRLGQEKQGLREEEKRLGQDKQELEQKKQGLQEEGLLMSQEKQLKSGVQGSENSKQHFKSPKLSSRKEAGSASLQTESPGRNVQNGLSAKKAVSKASKSDKKTAVNGARSSLKSPAMSPIQSAAESANASPAKVAAGSGSKSSANGIQTVLDSQRKSKTTANQAKNAATGRKLTAREAAAKATQQRLIKAKNVISATNAFAKSSKKGEEMNSSRRSSASSSGSATRVLSTRGTGTKESVAKQSKASDAKSKSVIGRKISTSGVRGKEEKTAGAKQGSIVNKEKKVASKEDNAKGKAASPGKGLQKAQEPIPAVSDNKIDAFEEQRRRSDEQKDHLDDDIRNNNVIAIGEENIAAIDQQTVEQTPQDFMNDTQESRAQERKNDTHKPAIVEEDIAAMDQRVVEQTPDYPFDLSPQAGDQKRGDGADKSKGREEKLLAMEDEIVPAIGDLGVEETPEMDFDFDAFDMSPKGKDIEQSAAHSKNVDSNKALVDEGLQNVAEDAGLQSQPLIDFADTQLDSKSSGFSGKAEKQQQKEVVVEDDISAAAQERGLEQTPALDFGFDESASPLSGAQHSNQGIGTTKSGVKPTTDAMANKGRLPGDQDSRAKEKNIFDGALFEDHDLTTQQQLGRHGTAEEGELKRAPSLDEFEMFEAEILGRGEGASSVVSPEKDNSKSEQINAGEGSNSSRKSSIARKTSVTRKTSITRKTSVTRKDSSGSGVTDRASSIVAGKEEKAAKGESSNINDADRKRSVGRRQSQSEKRRSLGENGDHILEDVEDQDVSLEDIASGYYTPPEYAGTDIKGINILMDLSKLEGASVSTVNGAAANGLLSLNEAANVQDVKDEQDITNDRSSSAGAETGRRVSGDLAATRSQISTGDVEQGRRISGEEAARRDQLTSGSVEKGRRVSGDLAATRNQISTGDVEQEGRISGEEAARRDQLTSGSVEKGRRVSGDLAATRNQMSTGDVEHGRRISGQQSARRDQLTSGSVEKERRISGDLAATRNQMSTGDVEHGRRISGQQSARRDQLTSGSVEKERRISRDLAATRNQMSTNDVEHGRRISGEQAARRDQLTSGSVEKGRRVSGDLAATRNLMSTGDVEQGRRISGQQSARRDQLTSGSVEKKRRVSGELGAIGEQLTSGTVDNGQRVSGELGTTNNRASSDSVEKGRLATNEKASMRNQQLSSGNVDSGRRVSGELGTTSNRTSSDSVENGRFATGEKASMRNQQLSSGNVDSGRRVSGELGTTSNRTSSDSVEKERLATGEKASIRNQISSDNAKKGPLANGEAATMTTSASSSKDENQNEFKAKASNARMSWRRTFSKIKAVPSVEGFRRRSIVNIKVVDEGK